MHRFSAQSVEEVWTSIALSLDQHPEGVSVSSVYKSLLKDRYHITVVYKIANYLEEEGYLRSIKAYQNQRQVRAYCLTGKEFVFEPEKAPEPPMPASSEQWTERLEAAISCVQELQKVLSGTLACLLDLSKDVERLSKVKDILGNLKNEVRKNI